jgi:hypothetical protein
MPIQDGQWLSKSDRGFALWAGLFSGPIAWAFQQQISYLLVPLACRTGHHFSLHLAAIVALLLIVGGGAIIG